jgi:phage major head subunit gpT-like protein
MAITLSTPERLNNITRLLNREFQTSYKAGLELSNNWTPPHVAGPVDTVKRAVDFIFYGDVDEPEELGEFQDPEYVDLAGYELYLQMKEYQNGPRIPKKDWVADEIGALQQQVMSMGEKYSLIWRFLAIDILNNGATSAVTTYDGVPLYSNAHVVGLGTFDNLLTGTGNFATDLQTAYTAMQKFVNDKNVVRDANEPTHVVYPTELHFTVLETLRNRWDPRDEKSTENVNVNLVSPIVEQRLSDVNDWFIFKSTPSQKPFIGITNKAASSTNDTLVNMNKVNPANQIVDKFLKWSIHQYRGLHPTHPHLHAKMVNA